MGEEIYSNKNCICQVLSYPNTVLLNENENFIFPGVSFCDAFLNKAEKFSEMYVGVCNYISYILQSVTLCSNSQLYLNWTETGSLIKYAHVM